MFLETNLLRNTTKEPNVKVSYDCKQIYSNAFNRNAKIEYKIYIKGTFIIICKQDDKVHTYII